jgi:hypothetical protein
MFTAEMETNTAINYLDITIQRTPTNWKTSTEKPRSLTPSSPIHPTTPLNTNMPLWEFLYNRQNVYNLQDDYKQEENIIHNIVHNNSFPIYPQKPHNNKPKKKSVNHTTPIHKWATFTYTGKETTFITNIIRQANLKIAFCTNNTIHNRLMHKNQITDKYALSGVYKLTCPKCKKADVGQNDRSFTICLNEHKNVFQSNSHTSKFAQHLTEQVRSFDTIHNTMQVLQYQKKGAHLNTIEWFYIYTECATKNHLNDSQTIFPNTIWHSLKAPPAIKNHPTHPLPPAVIHTYTPT